MKKLFKRLNQITLHYYKAAAQELLEENDASTVIAAVLKMLTKEPDQTPIKLTEEQSSTEERQKTTRS